MIEKLQLAIPFQWKTQTQGYDYLKKKSKITLVSYVDARSISQFLDDIVKPHNWKNRHYECNGNVYCEVSIYSNERNEWISRTDSGENKRDYLKTIYLDYIQLREKYINEIDLEKVKYKKDSDTQESIFEKQLRSIKKELDNASKSEATDAFKRACVQFGIGRFLYSINEVEIYLNDKDFVLDENGSILQSNNKNVYKSDNKTISDYCNKICDIPKVLIDEINNCEIKNKPKDENDPIPELKSIYDRMDNLHKNKKFLKLISDKKKSLFE